MGPGSVIRWCNPLATQVAWVPGARAQGSIDFTAEVIKFGNPVTRA